MKILYVCSDFGIPVYGQKGASVHVRELCRALRTVGHEVLIVSPRVGGAPPSDFDTPVLELPVDPADELAGSLLARDPRAGADVSREVKSLLYAASRRQSLAAAAADFAADLVYERYSLLASAGGWAARKAGIPHLLEVNAPLADEQAAYRGLAYDGTVRELERNLLLAADGLVAVSPGIREWLLGLGVARERILVVPNAVDPDRFAGGEAARELARERLRLNGEPAIGFLGTLKPWHDVDSLVRAVGLLDRAGMRLRLVVIGDGPERLRLQALAAAEGVARSTTFLGSIAHGEVPGYLAALDAAVAPYRARAHFYFSPLKLFEYLASGVPVVAADIGDLRHCFRRGQSGLLYAPGDVRALADALLTMLLDPGRAAELGAAGRRHVLEYHTWTGNAEAVAGFARGLAAGRSEALACA